MADYLRAKFPIEGKDGKTYWKDIGVAFPHRERPGAWNVTLELMPLANPQTGKINFGLYPPEETDRRQGGSYGRQEPRQGSGPQFGRRTAAVPMPINRPQPDDPGRSVGEEIDDEIPF